MVKIIIHGCCGHMGQVISDLVEKDTNAEIVAGIDVTDKGNTSYPVFTDIHECKTEADVLIDFSSAKAADALLDYCVERSLPVVLCTTGLSEEQLAKVEETAKKIPVLKSANMSLGINTLMKLIQDAAKVLATAGFDLEINEKVPTQFHCNCTKERVEKALISIGRKEIQELIDEGNTIHFKG